MQIFPKWANKVPLAIAAALPLVGVGVVGGIWYFFSPKFTDVGYQPKQPVPYSHKLHAGELGIDCLYCHGPAEVAAHATVPASSTCMNCHQFVRAESEKLKPVRDAHTTDQPLEWVRIHKMPDYVFFDHSAHLNAGVGCVECHGRVDQMVTVRLEKPLSMSWCLDCHKNPQGRLRPKELVTKMDWKPAPEDTDKLHAQAARVAPPVHCSGCHR